MPSPPHGGLNHRLDLPSAPTPSPPPPPPPSGPGPGVTPSPSSGAGPIQGCIRRKGASEAAPKAVRQAVEVAKAVGGGYCRLQMPLKLAFAVSGTVAGHGLCALRGGGGGVPPPLPMHSAVRPAVSGLFVKRLRSAHPPFGVRHGIGADRGLPPNSEMGPAPELGDGARLSRWRRRHPPPPPPAFGGRDDVCRVHGPPPVSGDA